MIDEILNDIETQKQERFKKYSIEEVEKQIDEALEKANMELKEAQERTRQIEQEKAERAEKIRLIDEREAEQEKQYQIWLTDYYKREAQEQLRRDRMRRLGR